ncbi:MAG: hypothetical protein H7039_19550 [Bryobacteraceae bacterium]|nr:hypothetical protein [Bryobacteraceae bacterium]
MKKLASIGECFAVPLANGNFGHVQYVYQHELLSCLIQVFDAITDSPTSAEHLVSARPLFPPIFVGLYPPVRSGRWRRMGYFVTIDFQFPLFRHRHGVLGGLPPIWKLWDGLNYSDVQELTPEFMSLEVACVYSAVDVEERILTGENKFDKLWR